MTLNSYADIANGAQAVMDRCGTGSEVMGKAATGWAEGVQPGQQYSVVVTGGTC